MALRPVARKLVPDDVFDQLLDEMVDGDLSPGDSLPSERRLAEMLGVSRPAVREALQRMSQTRLVEVRHGGATTVRDFHRFAGLDMLSRLLVRNHTLDAAVGRSILEARLAIGPVVAAMAAARRGPERADELSAAVDALAGAADPLESQHAALAFWDVVTDAADSVVFRMMFNSLRLAYEPAIEALAPLMQAEVGNLASYRALTTAILDGDEAGSRAAADTLLRPATTAILAVLDRLEPDEATARPESKGR
jgi:GntR family transcriptional repressor for pyruvate dehydrogenase complex